MLSDSEIICDVAGQIIRGSAHSGGRPRDVWSKLQMLGVERDPTPGTVMMLDANCPFERRVELMFKTRDNILVC
jgi:hypothetical protein